MLFVGDDWGEDHHDIEIVDERGRRVAQVRLPEGLDGVSRLHALIAAAMPAEWAELEEGEAAARVKVGIETERHPSGRGWIGGVRDQPDVDRPLPRAALYFGGEERRR
jgi:hypothetical protein